ncbi:MAG: band 7 protein [Spirochaetes bacterium GWD1_27_9]|nr:MAG: band 7 protein [Spirochaetes bacterium GWB1_27_13]OHD26866.1 MAG: band 7 protein [Spirochaetes bacterium GWC1_27_15]OHD43011.1 MAG: band 7 protein [Spirochaetes bacterium GWD1_27_9]
MLGFKFIKTQPTNYVLLYKNGKIKKQGAGLSFFYYAPSSNVVVVPMDSKDAPFIFKESTADYQEINIQGQVTYKVVDPLKVSGILNFTVDNFCKYLGDGTEKLPLRLTNLVQVTIREKLGNLKLKEALSSTALLVSYVKEKFKNNETFIALGIEILDFAILKLSSTPEMSRALEASTRENLLKEADDAIYQRRNFAVEQERKIKENEIQTQISMEEKKRKILEEQMNGEIAVQEKQKIVEEAKMNTTQSVEQKKNLIEEEKLQSQIKLEEKRKSLVNLQSENSINQSKAKAESLKLELQALNSLNPELLEVLALNQMDSKRVISNAIKELAKNAQKIGNLNISPDLLNTLLTTK